VEVAGVEPASLGAFMILLRAQSGIRSVVLSPDGPHYRFLD